jgi:hypothetical protein
MMLVIAVQEQSVVVGELPAGGTNVNIFHSPVAEVLFAVTIFGNCGADMRQV